ncbi:MAG: DUF192 domain-containing protein [Actinomycetota bacterium]
MRRRIAVLLAAASLAACTGDQDAAPAASPEGFGRGTLVVATSEGEVRIEVEIADTTPKRVQGLRGRTSLPPEAGMVFLPERPERQLFVMEDTLIPLSVAWWDRDGRIFAIQDMEPCPAEPCPLYGTGDESAGAVEVNQGFFRLRGIKVGDRVTLER